MPIIAFAKVSAKSSAALYVALKYPSCHRESWGSLFIPYNIVEAIGLTPRRATLEEVIREFGEPEKVLGISDGTQLIVILYSLSKGYYVGYGVYPFHLGDPAVVKPADIVAGIWLFDPRSFDKLLTNGPMVISKNPVYQNGVLDWAGYGPIRYIDQHGSFVYVKEK